MSELTLQQRRNALRAAMAIIATEAAQLDEEQETIRTFWRVEAIIDSEKLYDEFWNLDSAIEFYRMERSEMPQVEIRLVEVTLLVVESVETEVNV